MTFIINMVEFAKHELHLRGCKAPGDQQILDYLFGYAREDAESRAVEALVKSYLGAK